MLFSPWTHRNRTRRVVWGWIADRPIWGRSEPVNRQIEDRWTRRSGRIITAPSARMKKGEGSYVQRTPAPEKMTELPVFAVGEGVSKSLVSAVWFWGKMTELARTVTYQGWIQKDPPSRSREGQGESEPGVLGKGLLASGIGNGVIDLTVELESHPCRLVP